MFVLVASLGVLSPLVIALVLRERSGPLRLAEIELATADFREARYTARGLASLRSLVAQGSAQAGRVTRVRPV